MTEEIKNQRDEAEKLKRAVTTLTSIMQEQSLEIKKYKNKCQRLEMQLKEQGNVKRDTGAYLPRPSNRREIFVFPNTVNSPVINRNRTYHQSKSLEINGPTSKSSLNNNSDTLATDNNNSIGASGSLDPASMPVTGGVSVQIFNKVVNELVKTKLRLQDLQKEKGVDSKSYIISKQTQAELQYLQNEHQRLRQENEDLKLKVDANKVLINQSSLSPKPFSPSRSPKAVGASVRPQDSRQVSTQTDTEQVKPANVLSQAAQTDNIIIRDDAEDPLSSVGQQIEELKQQLDKARQEKETSERSYEHLLGSLDEMERTHEDKVSSLQQTNKFLVSERQHWMDEYSKLDGNARILREKLREEVQKNQHLQNALQQLDSGSDFDSFSQRLPFQSLYGRDSLSSQGSQHSRESPHHFAERNPVVTTPYYQPSIWKSSSQQILQRNDHPAQTVGQSGHPPNHPPSERDTGIHQTVSQVSTARQMGNMSQPMAQVATPSTNREGYIAQPLSQGVTPPNRGYYISQPVSEVSTPSPGRGGYIPQTVSQAGYTPDPLSQKRLGHQTQVVSPGGGDTRNSDSGRDHSEVARSAFLSAQAGLVREPPVGDDISPETVYHTQHVCERCFAEFKTYDLLLHHYQKCLD